MTIQLSRAFVEKAIGPTVWDFGNSILYDLCQAHPRHEKDEIIIAKIWLIGRSYAAAIERRLKMEEEPVGDRFYEDNVAPKIRGSTIDCWFDSISACGSAAMNECLVVHRKVTELFSEISQLKKRSLASKYLHFHFPARFYIYDSRARQALARLGQPVRGRILTDYDREYAAFYFRCESLNDEFEELIGRRLTPRELDKLLLSRMDSKQRVE